MTRSVKNENLSLLIKVGMLFYFSSHTKLYSSLKFKKKFMKRKENVPQRGVPLELERIYAN